MKETSRVHCCNCGMPVALQIDKDGLRRALASHWRDDLTSTILAHVTVACQCAHIREAEGRVFGDHWAQHT